MKKILFLFFCIIAGIIIGKTLLSHKDITPRVLPSSEKSIIGATTNQFPNNQNSKGIIPTSFSIPKIEVTAKVESVGMDPQGRMDIPKDDLAVAWYKLGFKPGSQGSAVIDGHFDRANGAPAVFYNLNKLTNGDKIIVTDDQGHTLTFIVTGKELYPFNDFPLQKVFNTTDQPRLNLITCDGVWSSTAHNYSQRLVIYSTLQST